MRMGIEHIDRARSDIHSMHVAPGARDDDIAREAGLLAAPMELLGQVRVDIERIMVAPAPKLEWLKRI